MCTSSNSPTRTCTSPRWLDIRRFGRARPGGPGRRLLVPPVGGAYRQRRRGSEKAKAIANDVDRHNPGDPRFKAFLRTFVAEEPLPGDVGALAELRRGADAGAAFSLYLRAMDFQEVIVTLTEEGDVVLGLGAR